MKKLLLLTLLLPSIALAQSTLSVGNGIVRVEGNYPYQPTLIQLVTDPELNQRACIISSGVTGDGEGKICWATGSNATFEIDAGENNTLKLSSEGSINLVTTDGLGEHQALAAIGDGVSIGTSTRNATLYVRSATGTVPFTIASSSNANLFVLDQNGHIQMSSSTADDAILSLGNVIITGVKITPKTRVILTPQNCVSCAIEYISATTSDSFTISSRSLLDSSTVFWTLYERS